MMKTNIPNFVVKDIPLDELIPSQIRPLTPRDKTRLLATIKRLGIIEPLIVFREEGGYQILDGYFRYLLLKELECQTAPCIISYTRDMLSPHKYVCHISPTEESRMLTQATEVLSEKEIAAALGITTITHRLNKQFLSKLHPNVTKALNSEKISKKVAQELTYVSPERQCEILAQMQELGNFSVEMVRQLVRKTPVRQRRTVKGHTPWSKSTERKKGLFENLEAARKNKDYSTMVFHQLTLDLVRCVGYARQIIDDPILYEYLQEHFPHQLKTFQDIIRDESGGTDEGLRVPRKPKKPSGGVRRAS